MELIAYMIQPYLGPLAGHALAVAWAGTIAVAALVVWFVAGFF